MNMSYIEHNLLINIEWTVDKIEYVWTNIDPTVIKE